MKTSFRLVTANLWNGAADPAAFAAQIEELGADIVAVQELSAAQADALARVLPYGVLEPADDCSGMGIALRRPGSVRRLALPCRDARVAEVEIATAGGADVSVEIINIHVQAPHSAVPWRTINKRAGQWRGLQQHLDATPNRRRAVVGDFNATPRFPFYRNMVARLTDAAVDAAQRHGGRIKATWGPTPKARRLLRIDHVFVHGLAVHEFRVVPVKGGDHSAVFVDLSVTHHVAHEIADERA